MPDSTLLVALVVVAITVIVFFWRSRGSSGDRKDSAASSGPSLTVTPGPGPKDKDKAKPAQSKPAPEKEKEKIVKHASCIVEMKLTKGATSIAFDPKGRYLALVGHDRALRLYEMSSLYSADRKHFLITIEGDRPDLVRFAPDGRHLLITLSSTQRFTAYKIFPHKNSEHGKMAEAVRTFPSKHVTELKSIQMAGQFIVTCGTDNFVNLWDVHGNVVGTLNARGMGNTMATLSADSKLVSAAAQMADVKIWKVKEDSKGVFQGVEDKPFTVLTGKNGHKSGVVAVEFSADSKRAVTTAKDGTFKFWNLEGDYRGGFEPTVLFTGSNPENTPYTRALVSPTDRFVAFSFGRTVHVWTLSSAPALLLNLKNCHGGEILDLAWSPKGSLLATVSADAHVRLFRLTEDQEH